MPKAEEMAKKHIAPSTSIAQGKHCYNKSLETQQLLFLQQLLLLLTLNHDLTRSISECSLILVSLNDSDGKHWKQQHISMNKTYTFNNSCLK